LGRRAWSLGLVARDKGIDVVILVEMYPMLRIRDASEQ
jgi:hypothetical protein